MLPYKEHKTSGVKQARTYNIKLDKNQLNGSQFMK
jgi:hypothetical protein